MSDAAPITAATLRAAIDSAFAAYPSTDPAPEYDVLAPETSASPLGVVLTVHGGSWYMTGRTQMAEMADAASRWRARGWLVVQLTHRPRAQSLPDLLLFHDAARSALGPGGRLGMHGASAGGHLALMTAIERPGVEFVVAEAAPTDLVLLGGTARADEVRQHAITAFGEDSLEQLSPARRSTELDARILLATCVDDEVVPVDQMRYMYNARPAGTNTMVLQAGSSPFIHADVGDLDAQALHEAERKLTVVS